MGIFWQLEGKLLTHSNQRKNIVYCVVFRYFLFYTVLYRNPKGFLTYWTDRKKVNLL